MYDKGTMFGFGYGIWIPLAKHLHLVLFCGIRRRYMRLFMFVKKKEVWTTNLSFMTALTICLWNRR